MPVRAASEELLLDCGDGVDLQAFHASPAKRGRDPGKTSGRGAAWLGGQRRFHVRAVGWRRPCSTLGFEVVRLNLRDHGATHHLNRDLFHSCRLPEVVGAVRTLAQQFRGPAHGARGFSLGGNFMLRVAADPKRDICRSSASSPCRRCSIRR